MECDETLGRCDLAAMGAWEEGHQVGRLNVFLLREERTGLALEWIGTALIPRPVWILSEEEEEGLFHKASSMCACLRNGD